MNSNKRLVLFPGSFDPFTFGHADLVERALDIFDSVCIAVGYNEQKTGWIPVDERVRALKELYKDDERISVIKYDTLTTDVAKETGAGAILRGVRSMKDYEYEMQMADINRKLSGLETVILFSKPELTSISSSLVRELVHFGKDVTSMLPIKISYKQ